MACYAIREAIEKSDYMILLKAIKYCDMVWDFVYDNGVRYVIR